MLKPQTKTFLVLLILLAMPHLYHGQSGLADSLKDDVTLQDTTIIAIRSALGARDRANVVRRGSFSVEVQFYIEIYRELRDESTLANIQNRYIEAKTELLEPRLPATVEELVSILETL